MKKILLTGGLGYIGSHIAALLKEKAIIIDNLSNSNLNYKKYLPYSKVYKEDLNPSSLNKVFTENEIKGVIHLAGLKSVENSVKNPFKYYRSNILPSIDLLEAMNKNKINKLIFSSSATVYGDKYKSPLNENLQLQSTNPYGSTKIIIEQLISDYSKSNSKFKAISLRYFNPIGADNSANLSEMPIGTPQNIIPVLINAIKKHRVFNIFGKNYKTKDGTCIRDYIHVKDLALAHIEAFRKLKLVDGHLKINLGLGKGLSVLELIKSFEEVNKVKVKYKFTKRRKGDVDIVFAHVKKAHEFLNWKPKYTYQDMLKDAWEASKVSK